MKKYTVNNMKKLWKMLDEADSNLRLVGEYIHSIKTINSILASDYEKLDLSVISSLKQTIEQLIEGEE